MIIGIIILVIGLAFLLQALGFISVSAWQFIWPTLLIIAGMGIICKEKGKCCCGDNCEKPKK